ncbi:MAG: HIT family protein [Thermoanaerobaculia bacterium]
MTCVLCDTPDQTGEIVFEDNSSLVIIHDDWATRGHLMVVWKAHVQNLSDLSDIEASHFLCLYRLAERAVLDATGAERSVILKLGIAVPHLHVHIYPVSASLDRTGVMQIIEARVRDFPEEGTRRALVQHLREHLATSS